MNLLILGANSDVAYATALKFAEKTKANITLASRKLESLQKKAKDIQIRHNVTVTALAFDATDTASHQIFYDRLNPKPDGVVIAFGYLGNQAEGQSNFKEAEKIIHTNFTGAVSILEITAADLEQRGTGFIIGISSVAGERGRQSNYLYGAAKGALSIYLSGLRNRLSKKNIHVVTIHPGFIDTKMTMGLNLPSLLTASAEQVAEDIFQAYQKSKNSIYTPWYWSWIMTVIKAIPESIFKRLSL